MSGFLQITDNAYSWYTSRNNTDTDTGPRLRLYIGGEREKNVYLQI